MVFRAPSQQIPLNEPLWIPPVSLGGMLWILTGKGNLYRYSPGQTGLKPVAGLGEGFGQAPLLARTVRRDGSGAAQDLWLLAASPREIKAYGLLDERIRTVFRCDGARTILADCVRASAAMEADSRHLHWILQEGGALSVQSWDETRGEIRCSITLMSPEAAGVAVAADLVFVCGRYHLTAFRTPGPAKGSPGAHQIPLPADFEPRIRRDRNPVGPKPAPGRMLLNALREWLYVPGRHRGAPALLALNASRPASDANILPLEKDAVFDRTDEGSFLWTTRGRILRLRDGGFEELLADSQISPDYPCLADDLLKVAFVETPQGDKIRFYLRQRQVDCELATLEGFSRCVSVCGVGDSIVLAYTNSAELGYLAIWRA